jgi:hypothetical protein
VLGAPNLTKAYGAESEQAFKLTRARHGRFRRPAVAVHLWRLRPLARQVRRRPHPSLWLVHAAHAGCAWHRPAARSACLSVVGGAPMKSEAGCTSKGSFRE